MDIITLLMKHEGKRNHIYLDSKGIPTIGVGLNMRRPDSPARLATVGANYNAVLAGDQDLTDEQITTLLQQDVDALGPELDQLVPEWRSWPPNPQLVIQDLIFNLGSHGLSGFPHTLAAFNAQDWQSAAAHRLRWRSYDFSCRWDWMSCRDTE